MTSEEKLAKIMAQRALRTILQNYAGTMDFHEMTQLFANQVPAELTGGEAEVFRTLKEVLGRKDDRTLEDDMQRLDAFKAILSEQFDELVHRQKIELGG